MGERGLRPILLAYTLIDVETSQPKIQKIFKQKLMKGSSSQPRLAAQNSLAQLKYDAFQ